MIYLKTDFILGLSIFVIFFILLYFLQGDVNFLEKKQQADSSIITQKDIQIKKLQNNIISLEQNEQDLNEETNRQHEEILSLKQEINILENSINMRMVELDNKKQSIKILERQLMEMKEKVWDFLLITIMSVIIYD